MHFAIKKIWEEKVLNVSGQRDRQHANTLIISPPFGHSNSQSRAGRSCGPGRLLALTWPSTPTLLWFDSVEAFIHFSPLPWTHITMEHKERRGVEEVTPDSLSFARDMRWNDDTKSSPHSERRRDRLVLEAEEMEGLKGRELESAEQSRICSLPCCEGKASNYKPACTPVPLQTKKSHTPIRESLSSRPPFRPASITEQAFMSVCVLAWRSMREAETMGACMHALETNAV